MSGSTVVSVRFPTNVLQSLSDHAEMIHRISRAPVEKKSQLVRFATLELLRQLEDGGEFISRETLDEKGRLAEEREQRVEVLEERNHELICRMTELHRLVNDLLVQVWEGERRET